MLKIASIVSYALMAFAFAGLLATGSLFSPSPFVVLAQAAGVALMVWARLTFRRRSFHFAADPTPGGLVTVGPYRFIRHPIYTAACLFAWSGVLAHPSDLSFLFGVLLFVGALGRMLSEERLVAEAYPGYRQYALRTKRMVPYLF